MVLKTVIVLLFRPTFNWSLSITLDTAAQLPAYGSGYLQ